MLTKKQFYKTECPKNIKSNILAGLIISYACVIISLVSLLNSIKTVQEQPDRYVLNKTAVAISVILIVVVLLAALVTQFTLSPYPGFLTLIASIVNTVYTIQTSGEPTGYLVIVAAIFMIIGGFQLDKAYKNGGSAGGMNPNGMQ